MSEAKIKITAEDAASRVLAQVRGSMASMQASATALTGALGLVGGASLGGLAIMVKSISDGLDAMNDLKDATGATIENISALEDVAVRTGTSFDTVGASLIKFNQALNAADPDSKAARALDAIGLSAKDLKALDPAEALRQTAVALANFADDGNKARLTQELFGKSLKEVAPFLKDLSEQGQLNATVTTAQAQAAEDFNKQLFNLQKNVLDVGRSITSFLLPTLVSLSDEMVIAKKNSIGFLDAMATQALQNPFKSIGGNLDAERESLAALEEDRQRFLKGGNDTGSIDTAIGTIKRRIEYYKELQRNQALALGAESDAETKRLSGQSQAKKSVGEIGGGKSSAGKSQKEQIDDNARALASYVQGLESQLTTTQKLTEEQKSINFLKSLGTIGEVAQVRELVLGQAQRIDTTKAEIEAQKQLTEARQASSKYIEDLVREQAAISENNQKLRDQLEEIGLTKEALDTLRLARMDATMAQEQETLALLTYNEGSTAEIALQERKIALLREQRELTAQGQVKQAASDTKVDQDRASKQYADTLRGDLKGAFSAAFRDSEDPLKAFGSALENVIYTRAATALAEALAEAALQQAATSFGGSSGGGGFFADLFKSFDGGGSTGAGARSGGLDGKGGFMAMLHPQETVLDHTKGQMGVGGGSVNVIQNIQIDSRSDRATIMAAMGQAKEMAKAEILSSRRRGGAFA